MKKFLALLLALITVFSVTACSTEDYSDTTKLEVIAFDAGVGTNWLNKAIDRFEEKQKNVSYAEGKTGVVVKVTPSSTNTTSSMSTDGYHVYIYEGVRNIVQLAAVGATYNVVDWITEDSDIRDGKPISIIEKIDDAVLESMKGLDGGYYALPSVNFLYGLSYNQELFDNYALYFAAPEETNVVNYTSGNGFGSAKFIQTGAKKSCGPDGEYKTVDDGLPSSLHEFILLCDYAKETYSVSPVGLSGRYLNYINYFIAALWQSLAGDAYQAQFNFSGEIEVVTGLSEENLFPGIDYIKKPITETVMLTEKTGYLARDQVERYYALAMVEILEHEDWFGRNTDIGTNTHVNAQNDFIMGGVNGSPEIAMFCDGNYWWNESAREGTFDKYTAMTKKDEPQISWMPLPTQIDGQVQEGEGHAFRGKDLPAGYILVNNRISENAEIEEACKDFVQFIYTDEELAYFTAETGLTKALNYDLPEGMLDSLTTLAKSCWLLTESSTMPIYNFNDIYKNHIADFSYGLNDPTVKVTTERGNYNSFLDALRSADGSDTWSAFQCIRLTKEVWDSRYLNN